VTRAQATMAIVTMEDLQGSIEVVVFPRLYEQTMPTWRDGAILLVAGRVDHKGDEIALLADLATDWDDASAAGPDAFGRQVAASDRGGRRPPPGGNGPAAGSRFGSNGGSPVRAPLVPVGPGAPEAGPVPAVAAGGGVAPAGPASRPAVPYVSPRRGGSQSPELPQISPAEPIGIHIEVPGALPAPDDRDEPAIPDEARDKVLETAINDMPIEAGPSAVLHVTFAAIGSSDRVIGAMETFKSVLRERPGETRVVLHVPGLGGGVALPMELRRGVAYDAELLAEIRRRLGEGLVDLQLGPA
jgi:OB-fold nucleic acid binding protein